MPKFKVSLHGTGCLIEVTERKWGLPRSVARPVGFYTTRFIEAASSEEAASRAIATVQEEVKDVNRSDLPPTISVEEVEEDPAAFAKYAPGSGFTWYREDPSGQHNANGDGG